MALQRLSTPSTPQLQLLRLSACSLGLGGPVQGWGTGTQRAVNSISKPNGSEQGTQGEGDKPPPLRPEVVAEIVNAFNKNPTATAHQLTDLMPLDHRVEAFLHSKDVDTAYASRLFRAADTDEDKGRLSEQEFKRALELHRAHKNLPHAPPTTQALRLCFLAASIPFIAFGFLDNFIMLFAGEEIDHLFGVRLGLSTLASAGLGNTMADIIGVSAASGIEAAARKLPFLRDAPKLTKQQAQTSPARAAKALGAAAGVTLGCLIGLVPLLLQGNFFVER